MNPSYASATKSVNSVAAQSGATRFVAGAFGAILAMKHRHRPVASEEIRLGDARGLPLS